MVYNYGPLSKSNIHFFQQIQNNNLKVIADVSWYSRKTKIHDYRHMPTISEEIELVKINYKVHLSVHPIPLSSMLLTSDTTKILKWLYVCVLNN